MQLAKSRGFTRKTACTSPKPSSSTLLESLAQALAAQATRVAPVAVVVPVASRSTKPFLTVAWMSLIMAASVLSTSAS